MKLGILQCDSVLDTYQGQFGDYPDMFRALFKPNEPKMEFVTYDVRENAYPTQIDECDAYLITGSKASVYDDLPWLPECEKFIRTLHRRKQCLIGICFGHQLIADVLGGKTEKAPQGWGVGVAINQVYVKAPWMRPYLSAIGVIVSHQDQVTTLPTDAVLVAGSEFCPHFMYQIDDHILTIQGHPEYSKRYSETLMRHRAATLGEDTYRNGMSSLALPTDELTVAQWIINFIRR